MEQGVTIEWVVCEKAVEGEGNKRVRRRGGRPFEDNILTIMGLKSRYRYHMSLIKREMGKNRYRQLFGRREQIRKVVEY